MGLPRTHGQTRIRAHCTCLLPRAITSGWQSLCPQGSEEGVSAFHVTGPSSRQDRCAWTYLLREIQNSPYVGSGWHVMWCILDIPGSTCRSFCSVLKCRPVLLHINPNSGQFDRALCVRSPLSVWPDGEEGHVRDSLREGFRGTVTEVEMQVTDELGRMNEALYEIC